MNQSNYKSYCKINLFLKVIKKLKSGNHEIESLITFGNIYDEIKLSERKKLKDSIRFKGPFRKKICTTSNTITKTLKLLRSRNLLKKKFFKIELNKNIPHSAGLGGGSSNAATLILNLNKKYNLKLNKSQIYNLAKKVGSDVPVFLDIKNALIYGRYQKIKRFKKSLNLNLLIVFPNIACITKKIYLKNNSFSKPKIVRLFNMGNKRQIVNFIKSEQNDLQKTVVKLYPKIGNLITFILKQKGCIFSRLTGSGSACVGAFSSLRLANLAKRIVKKNFPKYWSVTSKSI